MNASELSRLFYGDGEEKPSPTPEQLTRVLAWVVCKFGGEDHSVTITKDDKDFVKSFKGIAALDATSNNDESTTLSVRFFSKE